jgi:ABC-type transporter Mla subunit MlaD
MPPVTNTTAREIPMNTHHRKLIRKSSIIAAECNELLNAVDDLTMDCAEHDTAAHAVAQELADVIGGFVDFSESLARVKDGVADISERLEVDGWDAYDASRELDDYANTLDDLNSESRETARALILLTRAVLDISD